MLSLLFQGRARKICHLHVSGRSRGCFSLPVAPSPCADSIQSRRAGPRTCLCKSWQENEKRVPRGKATHSKSGTEAEFMIDWSRQNSLTSISGKWTLPGDPTMRFPSKSPTMCLEFAWPPQNASVEIPALNVLVFGDGTFGRWSGHESGSLTEGTYEETPENSLTPSATWGHSKKTTI